MLVLLLCIFASFFGPRQSCRILDQAELYYLYCWDRGSCNGALPDTACSKNRWIISFWINWLYFLTFDFISSRTWSHTLRFFHSFLLWNESSMFFPFFWEFISTWTNMGRLIKFEPFLFSHNQLIFRWDFRIDKFERTLIFFIVIVSRRWNILSSKLFLPQNNNL